MCCNGEEAPAVSVHERSGGFMQEATKTLS